MRIVLKRGVKIEHAQVLIDFFQKQRIYYRLLEHTPSLELLLNGESVAVDSFEQPPFVELIESIIKDKSNRYFTNRAYRAQKNQIHINGISFGGNNIPVIAGPCSIESAEHIDESAAQLSQMGVQILRGGAFKPRTSTYDFQGLGREGLRFIAKAAKKHGMLSVTEIMDAAEIDAFMPDIDIIQVGARNMQNFPLLKLLGTINKPILLKRGAAATYHEFLNAAEYIASRGNEQIILCERGIRTYEHYTRNTLDIAAIPVLKDLSHLPIIVDPSHAVGLRDFVPSLTYAALAAGADGLMIEAHPYPERSVSDAAQTISFHTLATTLDKGREITQLFGKTLGRV